MNILKSSSGEDSCGDALIDTECGCSARILFYFILFFTLSSDLASLKPHSPVENVFTAHLKRASLKNPAVLCLRGLRPNMRCYI